MEESTHLGVAIQRRAQVMLYLPTTCQIMLTVPISTTWIPLKLTYNKLNYNPTTFEQVKKLKYSHDQSTSK